MKCSGSVDGVFVGPCPVDQTLPVGSAAVPPQVQVASACADAAPHPPATSDAAAIAVTATIALGLIFPVSFRSRREMARGLNLVLVEPARPLLAHSPCRLPRKETIVAATYINANYTKRRATVCNLAALRAPRREMRSNSGALNAPAARRSSTLRSKSVQVSMPGSSPEAASAS